MLVPQKMTLVIFSCVCFAFWHVQAFMLADSSSGLLCCFVTDARMAVVCVCRGVRHNHIAIYDGGSSHDASGDGGSITGAFVDD